jgi:hypothetical protein
MVAGRGGTSPKMDAANPGNSRQAFWQTASQEFNNADKN